MQFRNASATDIPQCLELLRNDGGFQAEPELWDALPTLWASHLENNQFAGFQVFDKRDTSGERPDIAAFRISAFIRQSFHDDYAHAPHPQVAARIWRETLANRSPLLTRDEIAIANARGELLLTVLHFTLRHRNPVHPETANIMTLFTQAWQSAHFGYRLHGLPIYEIFGTVAPIIMKQIGYNEYEFALTTDGLQPENPGKSHIFYWDRTRSGYGFGGLIANTHLTCPAPRFFFTPAQQRLLLHALDGKPDKDIASEIGIRYDTVRQSWESIYRRVEAVDETTLPSAGARSAERRRAIVEYVRQHLEELRPYDRRAAGDANETPINSDLGSIPD